MKPLTIFMTVAIAILSVTLFTYSSSKNSMKMQEAKIISDTVYQCPMKCEGDKTYSKAGKCAVCHMNLKAKTTPVAVTQYQCPMKCESDKTYDKAGKCPVCNMNLKAKITPVATTQFQCPMKCEGDKIYDKAGKCPVCNMALKEKKEDHSTHQH